MFTFCSNSSLQHHLRNNYWVTQITGRISNAAKTLVITFSARLFSRGFQSAKMWALGGTLGSEMPHNHEPRGLNLIFEGLQIKNVGCLCPVFVVFWGMTGLSILKEDPRLGFKIVLSPSKHFLIGFTDLMQIKCTLSSIFWYLSGGNQLLSQPDHAEAASACEVVHRLRGKLQIPFVPLQTLCGGTVVNNQEQAKNISKNRIKKNRSICSNTTGASNCHVQGDTDFWFTLHMTVVISAFFLLFQAKLVFISQSSQIILFGYLTTFNYWFQS